MSSINWDELLKTAGDFEPVPDGEYNVVVISAEAGETQAGKDKIMVKFQIEGGPHHGRKLDTWHNTLSPVNSQGETNFGALRAWFRQLAAFGMKANFFKTDPSMETIAKVMEGKKVRVHTKIEEFRGHTGAKVKDVMPPIEGAQEVTVADVNDSFDSPAPSANKGDDIPF